MLACYLGMNREADHLLPCLRLGDIHATQVNFCLDTTCKPKTRLLTNRECPARASGPAEHSVALVLRSLTAQDKLLCPVCGCDSQHSNTARSPEIVCDLLLISESMGMPARAPAASAAAAGLSSQVQPSKLRFVHRAVRGSASTGHGASQPVPLARLEGLATSCQGSCRLTSQRCHFTIRQTQNCPQLHVLHARYAVCTTS